MIFRNIWNYWKRYLSVVTVVTDADLWCSMRSEIESIGVNAVEMRAYGGRSSRCIDLNINTCVNQERFVNHHRRWRVNLMWSGDIWNWALSHATVTDERSDTTSFDSVSDAWRDALHLHIGIYSSESLQIY